MNHTKTPVFLTPRGEEFNLGPETRLDRSELLCSKVLLKYKEIEKASDIGIRRGQKEYLLASVNNEVIYSKECLEVVKTSHNLHFKITELARRFDSEQKLGRMRNGMLLNQQEILLLPWIRYPQYED